MCLTKVLSVGTPPIPCMKAYKDFYIWHMYNKYMLTPLYYNYEIYDDVNKIYGPPVVTDVIHNPNGSDYPAGYHAYAQKTAFMSFPCNVIRCPVVMYDVHTIGIQADELVIVGNGFKIADKIGWYHTNNKFAENIDTVANCLQLVLTELK